MTLSPQCGNSLVTDIAYCTQCMVISLYSTVKMAKSLLRLQHSTVHFTDIMDDDDDDDVVDDDELVCSILARILVAYFTQRAFVNIRIFVFSTFLIFLFLPLTS